MKYPVYSIRDNKVSFAPPQVAENDAQMIRFFAMSVNNRNMPQNFAPADFDLYKVGFFDTANGVLEPLTPVELVISGPAVYGVMNNEKPKE